MINVIIRSGRLSQGFIVEGTNITIVPDINWAVTSDTGPLGAFVR